jgi:hypothetical protein
MTVICHRVLSARATWRHIHSVGRRSRRRECRRSRGGRFRGHAQPHLILFVHPWKTTQGKNVAICSPWTPDLFDFVPRAEHASLLHSWHNLHFAYRSGCVFARCAPVESSPQSPSAERVVPAPPLQHLRRGHSYCLAWNRIVLGSTALASQHGCGLILMRARRIFRDISIEQRRRAAPACA